MRRSQNRGRYRRLPGNQGASARQPHPIIEAFEFLADTCFERGEQIGDSEWKPQDFVFPFSTDDSEVTLSDYYDDCHYNFLFRTPKVLSYRRCDTEENVIREKIEALLNAMWNRASQRNQDGTAEPDPVCRLEIDFVKMLLACPDGFDDRDVTISDVKQKVKEKNFDDRLNISMIRVYLPSGPEALIGILQDLGAKLTKKETKKDTLRCACFRKNFHFRNRSFESSLFVDPNDLVFCDFQSIVYPGEGMCLANPGSDGDDGNGFICDLRIKAKTKVEHSLEDFQQLWGNLDRKPPPTLTKPGLGGLFRRKDDGFQCEQEAHINEILEKKDKTVHHFEMEGFTVILSTVDGREFHVERSGQTNVRYSFECWPKLLFILEDEDRIPALVDLAYRCIIAFFDALSEQRLEVRPWRCFGNLPDGFNVPCVDAQLLRRIRENDNLEDMLGVSGRRSVRFLSNRLEEVLKEMAGMRPAGDLDPVELRKKLIAAAKDRNIEVE